MAHFHIPLLLFHLYFHCVMSSSIMDYIAWMDAETTAWNKTGISPTHTTLCVTFQSKFRGIPASAEKTNSSPFVDLSYTHGCVPSDYDDPSHYFSGAAVAVSSGVCDDTLKARNAQKNNVSSILIVYPKNASALSIPSWRESPSVYDIIKNPIVVAGLSWDGFQKVKTLPRPVSVKIYAIPYPSNFNPNMIVMVCGPTLIILIGALWSMHTKKKKRAISSSLTSRVSPPPPSLVPSDSESPQLPLPSAESPPQPVFSRRMIICISTNFVALFIIGLLLSMFFAYEYAVYIHIVLLCTAGSHSLYQCLSPFWSYVLPCSFGIPLKCIESKLRLTLLLLSIICLTVGIVWAVQRHSTYAWILQDILGTALCIYFIRLEDELLSSLRAHTIVGVLFIVYDVFFVFITPLFMDGGRSIMVDAVTGGKRDDTTDIINNITDVKLGDLARQHIEISPIVFIIPHISNVRIPACYPWSPSLLGFGDILVPGMLIAYNAQFDVRVKSKMAYLVSSLTAYFVGMVTCLVALGLMESAQPALLYLVPTTLISTYAVALIRGEFGLTWKNEPTL